MRLVKQSSCTNVPVLNLFPIIHLKKWHVSHPRIKMIALRSVFMIFSHLLMCLSRGLFLSESSTKILNCVLSYAC